MPSRKRSAAVAIQAAPESAVDAALRSPALLRSISRAQASVAALTAELRRPTFQAGRVAELADEASRATGELWTLSAAHQHRLPR